MMRALPRCAVALAAVVLLIGSPALANMALEDYPVRHEATVDVTGYPDHANWSFFTWAPGAAFFTEGATAWMPYESGALVPDTKGGVLLYAIRRDRQELVQDRMAAASARPKPPAGTVQLGATTMASVVGTLIQEGIDGVAVSSHALGGRTFTNEGDPVRSTRKDFVLTDIADGKLVFDSPAQKHFDAARAELTPDVIVETRQRRTTAFLLLGSAGLLGLGFVIVRRARARPDAG